MSLLMMTQGTVQYLNTWTNSLTGKAATNERGDILIDPRPAENTSDTGLSLTSARMNQGVQQMSSKKNLLTQGRRHINTTTVEHKTLRLSKGFAPERRLGQLSFTNN